MRINAGLARGMRLKAPSNLRIRPMPERMKKALFSSLGEIVVGARVLDLFAGSGSLGIEVLSRGAAHVTFVDMGAESVRLVRHNLELASRSVEVAGRFDVVRDDVFAWLDGCARFLEKHTGETSLQPFDLILADPPYPKTVGLSLAEKLLQTPSLVPMLRDGGWLVVGHSKRDPVQPAEYWHQHRRLVHGDCVALICRKKL